MYSRFDNKELLIQNHIEGIFKIHPLGGEIMKNLGQQVKAWDALLVFYLTTRLDRVTLKEWKTF